MILFRYRILILWLLTGLLVCPLSAQTDLYSLQKRLQSKDLHEKERTDILVDLFDAYLYKDLDSSKYYAEQLRVLSQTGDSIVYAWFARTEAIYRWEKSKDESSLHGLDTAISIFQRNQEEVGLADAFRNKGLILDRLRRFPEAESSLSKSIDLLSPLDQALELGKSQAYLGLHYLATGDNEKTRSYLSKALEHAEKAGDKALTARVLSALGSLLGREGKYDKATQYQAKAFRLFQELGYQSYAANALINIANRFVIMGVYESAEENFEQALQLHQEVNNLAGIARAKTGLGTVYIYTKRQELAKKQLSEALEVYHELKNMGGITHTNRRLATLYIQEKAYEKARPYLLENVELERKIGTKTGLSHTLNYLSLISQEQGKLTQAGRYAEESLSLVRDGKNVVSIQNVTSLLYEIYKEQGAYEKSLEMFELNRAMMDTLRRRENYRSAVDFEFQQKALQDSLETVKLETELQLETERRANQQTFSIIIGISLLLISILALLNFRRLRTTQQQKLLIEQQKEKVEQSEKYKEQFLANMSHEIRTPMHAIAGMLNILQRNPHPKEQEAYLKAMQSSSENLIVILNDVLDLSKIEAGKLNIEQVPMNPGTILNHLEQLMKYKAEEKGLAFEVQVDDTVPELVLGDPTRLSQILTNLSGNAIKFTEKGRVRIKLSLVNERLHFEISDSGKGIPADQLARIFESFEQVDQGNQTYKGGTGLGLSISRQLVRLQGGKIWAESEMGKGSTFFFELPLLVPHKEMKEEEILTEESLRELAQAMKGLRILLVEDNPFNRMIAHDDLHFYFENVQLDMVENGQQALEAYHQGDYNLILMDAQMPVMNGFEASRAIRELELAQGLGDRIYIVAMTASLLKHELDRCFEAGMDAYIPKPYTAEELIGTLYKLMT